MKTMRLDHMISRTRQSAGKSRRANLLDMANYCKANPKEVNALTDDDRRDLSEMLDAYVPPEPPAPAPAPPAPAAKPKRQRTRGKLAQAFGPSVRIR